MNAIIWESGTPAAESFVRGWSALLRRSSAANFTLDLGFLDWEEAHGRRSRAILYDGDGSFAVVFRRTPAGWECGWPWRPQVVLDGGDEDGPAWPRPGDLRRVIHACARAAEIHHAHIFLPRDAVDERTAYLAGTTVSRRLDLPEERLYWGMDHNKRRNVRQALSAGFEVGVATTREEFRAFGQLQVATEMRRGARGRPLPDAPERGEDWREWELPWMWLLVARRAGRIEAGSGFGCFASGILDYRANASMPEAKLAGANALLAWEAMRRGSAAGYRRMNWGGNTIFKRGLGGDHIPMMCYPEGGPLWRVPDALEVQWHRARHRLARQWRCWATRRAGKSRAASKRLRPAHGSRRPAAIL